MIESERGVVYSERRNGEDSPFGSLYELLKASAFIAHPYHWPVVGWPSDIQSWTMEDLQTHFRMGYAPNNCVMVAVGDVKAEEVIALAKKYLEPIPRHDPPPPVRTVEPEQKGERRVELNKPAESPLLMIGYHVRARIARSITRSSFWATCWPKAAVPVCTGASWMETNWPSAWSSPPSSASTPG